VGQVSPVLVVLVAQEMQAALRDQALLMLAWVVVVVALPL
jgi:hypothetical protein